MGASHATLSAWHFAGSELQFADHKPQIPAATNGQLWQFDELWSRGEHDEQHAGAVWRQQYATVL